MRLSPEEKAANRAAFRAMDLPHKAEYVLAYYKLPLVIALVVAVAVGWTVQRALTRREPLLYAAFVNVVPPEAVDKALTSGFVRAQGTSPRRAEVYAYRELYLAPAEDATDHQYAYASRLKLMAAADAEQLDVALMNEDAWRMLSASGYLLDLREACGGDKELLAVLEPLLATGTVVLADNSVEMQLGEADAYEAQTVEAPNALEVTSLPLLADFSGDEPLYLGIVTNTPRLETARAYLRYLLDGASRP